MANKQDFEIGDELFNEELGVTGVVSEIHEDGIIVQWTVNEDEIIEEAIPLEELTGKGKLEGIINHHKKQANKYGEMGDAAIRATGDEEDEDAHEMLYRHMVHDEKESRGRALKNVRDRASVLRSAKAEHEKAKQNAKLYRYAREDTEMTDFLPEDSPALQTLKAGSMAVNDPKSKLEVMRAVIGKLGAMEDNEVVAFFNQVMGHIGNEDEGAPDAADKNRNSLNMHPSDAVGNTVKEDVAKLFEGQDVSEEFRDRTTTLFEAAVAAKVSIFEEEIREAYEQQLIETVEQLEEEFAEQLDEIENDALAYLEFTAQKWLEENQVAVVSTLRAEHAESFIEGLRNLCEYHYVDLPEEKADVLEDTLAENAELRQMLDEAIVRAKQLEEVIDQNAAESVFEQVADGLAMTEVEKFRTLAESVSFDGDSDRFRDKLTLIRETHFRKSGNGTSVTLTDRVGDQDGTITESADPRIAQAVKYLSGPQLL